MLKLFLLRHAKSSWDDIELIDFDRPLNKRGRKDTPKMAKHFIEKNEIPQLIIASPARRARETAELFCDKIKYDIDKIVFNENVYEASADTLLEIIHGINEDISSAMLVGHNPGLTELSNMLSQDVSIDNVPTCAIVEMHFDVKSWQKVEINKGSVKSFDYPKNL